MSNTSGWASYMSPTIRHIVVHKVDRAEIHMFDKPQKFMLCRRLCAFLEILEP